MPSRSWLLATGGREGTALAPGSAAPASCQEQLDTVHLPPSPPGTQEIPRLLLSWREVQHPRKAAAISHPDRSGRQERTGERCLNPKARGIFPAGSGWQRGTAQGQPGCLEHLKQWGHSLIPAPGLARGAHSNTLLANSPSRHQRPGTSTSTLNLVFSLTTLVKHTGRPPSPPILQTSPLSQSGHPCLKSPPTPLLCAANTRAPSRSST